MDVRGFVYSVVDIFPGPLKTPARWVADRLFGVWDDVSGVFRYIIPNWHDLANGIAWFTDKAVGALEKAAYAIRWIVTVRIPQAIEVFRQSVVNWVSGIINDVRSELISVRDWVLDKARGFANAVLDYARSVYQWAVDRIGDVWATLSTVAQLVSSLLTNPERMALWLIGAMWGAFWRFADQHIDAIVEFAWSRRGIIVSRVLARAEALLERIL